MAPTPPFPTPDDLPAAMAALREDWRRIEGEVMRERDPGWSEEEAEEFSERRAELLRDFLERHGAAVLAAGDDPRWFGSGKAAEALRDFRKADDEVKDAEEKLLHSGADVAEAMTALSVEMLGALEQLEALPAERWEAMEPMQRKSLYDMLLNLREAQPQMLAEMPLEVRREWEKRLGN